MRGVRFTKAERELLEQCLDVTTHDWSCFGTKANGLVAGILAKVRAAVEAPAGVSVKPIEDKLIKASRGKVIPLEGGHAVASRRLTAMKVTEEQAELVGAYMARQGWLTSPMTLLDVLNKWYQWLPKARATEPPPNLPAGLGPAGAPSERGPSEGPAAPSKAAAGRRTAQGFR